MNIDLSCTEASTEILTGLLNDSSIDLPQAFGLNVPKRSGKNLAVNFLASAKDLSSIVDSTTIKDFMSVMQKLYFFEDFYSRAIELWTAFGVTNMKIVDTDNDEFNELIEYWREHLNESLSIATPGLHPLNRLLFRQWWNLGNTFPYETWSMVNVNGKRYKMPMKITCLNPQNIQIDDYKAQLGIEEIGLLVPNDVIRLDGRSNPEIMPIKRGLTPNRIRKLKRDLYSGDIIIPINKKLVTHIKRHETHHNPWGIPFGLKAINAFADLHRKREMDFSVIDSMIRRILLFKIGTDDIPLRDSTRITQLVNLLNNPEPSFVLVTPHDVNYEDISPKTDVLDYEKKYEHEIMRILVALGVPPVLFGLTGSSKPEIEVSAFAESLKEVQETISNYIKRVLYKIIDQNPQFAGIKPKVTMDRINVNKDSHMTMLRDIYYTGNISHRTYLESIDIDYEQEKQRRENESKDGVDDLFVPHKQPFQGTEKKMEQEKTNTPIPDNKDDKKSKRRQMRKSFSVIFDQIDAADDLVLGFHQIEDKVKRFCKFYDKFYDDEKAKQLRDFYIDTFTEHKDMFKTQLFELIVGEIFDE